MAEPTDRDRKFRTVTGTGSMTAVPELFAKFFAYILLLDQEYTAGYPQRAYEEVRCDLAALLEEQEAAARQQGMSTQDYQAARFAAVSWADEILLQCTVYEHHQRWQAFPLQDEYYGADQAGAEVGEDLQRRLSLSMRPGVQEVYALCLDLGFSGYRHSGLSDMVLLPPIPSIPSSHPQPVQDAPLQLDDVGACNFKLTPQPYEVQPHAPRHWRRFLACVSLLLMGLCGGWWLLRRDATLPCLAPSLSGLTPMLADQPCAQASVAVQGCTVTLSGRVENADQRANIHRAIQSLASPVHIEDALHIIPRPFCEVLALLEPVQAHATTHALGLVARANKVGTPAVYVQEEDLVIEVTTPAQFESYIYIDFYDSNGRVHYLFFNPVFNRPFAPQSVQTLGYVDGQPAWGIGPPYGRGLVTVIASKTPLVFSPFAPQDDPGSATFYLSRLRQALPQNVEPAEVAATFFFIETRAQ